MKSQTSIVKPSINYSLVSAFLAFCLWASWTYWVNSLALVDVDQVSLVKSALAQGVASFIMTLIIIRAVSKLYGCFRHSLAKVIMPAFLITSFSGSGLAMLHLLIGTNRIFVTVSAPMTIAFCFCVFTAYRIRKQNVKEIIK